MIKKSHLTILLLILLRCSIHSQNFSKEFGEISKDEIELKQDSQNKGIRPSKSVLLK